MLKLLRAIDSTIQTQAHDRAVGLRASVFYGGTDPDANLSDTKWYRRMGGSPGVIPETTWNTIAKRARAMTIQNPLASGYSALMRLLTRGDYKPIAEDEKVQAWLDAFWSGPYNAWDRWVTVYHEEARQAGSIVLPLKIQGDGTVRMGYASAEQISEVCAPVFNPRHVQSCKWAVSSQKSIVLPVVRPWLDSSSSKHEGRLIVFNDADQKRYEDGHMGALHWRVGGLVADLRGMSEFSAALDFLMSHEEYQAAQFELAHTLGRIAADVTLNGEPDSIAAEKVRQRLETLAGMASVDVHGENESHDYSARNTLGADAAERDRMHGNYAIASLLMPPHIIRGDSGEGNRAVAKEQGTPAFLKIQSTIDDIADFGKHACQFALDTAVIQGKLTAKDLSFRMDRPNILKRDLPAAAMMIAKLADGLQVAEDREWISRELAQQTYVKALAEMGVTGVDIEQMQAKIAEEDQEFVNRGLISEGVA